MLAQWKLHQEGHSVSVQNVFLLVSTGLVSVYSWGFNTWGEAFFIMNFFHAVQYFGIVWATEKKSLVRLFRLSGRRFAKPIALLLLLGIGAAYGYFVQAEAREDGSRGRGRATRDNLGQERLHR